MSRSDVIELIEKEKLIVIVRGVAEEKIIPLADALYSGGVRVMEITYPMGGDPSSTARMIRSLSEHMDGKMCIGAGTVLTPEQVELTANAGGKFIISPNTCTEVIKKTVELELVSIPGALTPSEAVTAHNAGADFVKLFPITSLGTSYVKAVMAPLSDIKFSAVGGVDKNNIKDYINSGISCFGIGSNIIDKDCVKHGNFDKITELARSYLNIINGD